MRNRSRSLLVATVVGSVLALCSTPARASDVQTADDVCTADADPCVVAGAVRVAPGAILDFGTRSLSIAGSGRLEFGSGSATIQAGEVRATTGRDVLLAAGPSDGQTSSGSITILARRACSAGPTGRPCVGSTDCQLGACGARRCTGRPRQHCGDDSECAGSCTNRRCSNSSALLRCLTDADCDFGTCDTQLTCIGNGGTPKSCSTNVDCDLGDCSVGTGSILIEGNIDGMSGTPASVSLTAAGSVSLQGTVDLSATQIESDGGHLEVLARGGDARIDGNVRATGGTLGYGGVVDVEAEGDAIVDGTVNVGGGEGELNVTAGRDARLDSSVELSGRSLDNSGGYLYLSAGRDLWVGNGGKRQAILADGHGYLEGAGAGGDFYFVSGRDAHVASNVSIRLRGPRGGYGGGLDVDIGRDLEFAGRFVTGARAIGEDGGIAGYLWGSIGGDLHFPSTARLILSGYYAGSVDLLAEAGNATLDGSVRLRGDAGGEGGFAVSACDIRFGGNIGNFTTNEGFSVLHADRGVHLLPGSVMRTPKGENRLGYGIANGPPLVEGTVTPSPILDVLSLGNCPVCGDSEIDYPEDCDDGNASGGDGCSSRCRLE